MENNKKIIVPTIIAVVTLVLLVFGATYAYFTIDSTNNFGTKELNATVEDMADAVVLEQLENELSLNITRAMMSEDNAWTYYSTSGSYMPANIAKISVAGDGTYKCDYKITVTNSSTSDDNDLYTTIIEEGFGGEVIFSLNNDSADLVDDTVFPMIYDDTMYNITKETPKYITSNLYIYNDGGYEQNYLKGKDMTLTYNISDFECELSEPTGEYTELAFTGEYLDDIGYGEIIFNDSQYVFDGVFLLTENFVIPETFQGKDGVWYKVTSIENLTIDGMLALVKNIELPNTVKSIGDYVFTGTGPEIIKLPKQLTSVGEEIIAYSSVKNIYVPKSLTEIPAKAFANDGLENIYYEGTEAEWNALFSDYVGSGKEYSTIYEYLTYYPDEGWEDEPTIHFNVNY